jgi:hypothetical protein
MRIDEIKERVSKATPGPWKFDRTVGERYFENSDCGSFVGVDGEKVMDFGDSEQYYPTQGEAPNWEDTVLIENLHDDLQYLLSKLEIAEKALEEYTQVHNWYKDNYKGTPVFIWDNAENPWEPAKQALQQLRS